MTDEKLLVKYLSHHDGTAFEALLRRHGPMVLRVCRDILGDREHAEDAFQATFLVLLRRASSIRQQGSVDRWLYEVACRISRREQRRLAKLRSQERQAPEMAEAAPSDFDLVDRELKPILHEEIGRLPAKLRDAIVLCYLEGLTVDDAAKCLGCPVGTLKSRLIKARTLLRDRLTRRGLAASILLLLLFSLTEGQAAAAVPESLLDQTAKAGVNRLGDVGVSRRVASMVLLEESSTNFIRMATFLSVLIALLMVFGGSRLAQGRKAEGVPTSEQATSALRPAVLPSVSHPVAAPGLNPALAPLEHCAAPLPGP